MRCCDMCGRDTPNKCGVCSVCWGGVLKGRHNEPEEEIEGFTVIGGQYLMHQAEIAGINRI